MEDDYKKIFEYYRNNDFLSARKIINRVLDQNPNDADAIGMSALILLGESNEDPKKEYEGITLLEKAIELGTEKEVFFHFLGHCYMHLNDYKKVLWLYNKAEKLKITTDRLLGVTAIACVRLGDFDSAEKLLKISYEINPKCRDMLSGYTLFYLQKDNVDEGIKYAKKVLEVDPKNLAALTNIGACYMLKRDIKNAEKYYKMTLQINGNYLDALLNLALLYLAIGDEDNALKYMNRAISVRPDYHLVHYVEGQFELQRGNYLSALISLTKARFANPTNENTKFLIETLIQKIGVNFFVDLISQKNITCVEDIAALLPLLEYTNDKNRISKLLSLFENDVEFIDSLMQKVQDKPIYTTIIPASRRLFVFKGVKSDAKSLREEYVTNVFLRNAFKKYAKKPKKIIESLGLVNLKKIGLVYAMRTPHTLDLTLDALLYSDFSDNVKTLQLKEATETIAMMHSFGARDIRRKRREKGTGTIMIKIDGKKEKILIHQLDWQATLARRFSTRIKEIIQPDIGLVDDFEASLIEYLKPRLKEGDCLDSGDTYATNFFVGGVLFDNEKKVFAHPYYGLTHFLLHPVVAELKIEDKLVEHYHKTFNRFSFYRLKRDNAQLFYYSLLNSACLFGSFINQKKDKEILHNYGVLRSNLRAIPEIDGVSKLEEIIKTGKNEDVKRLLV